MTTLDAVDETPVWLELNGTPVVTWMCTPDQLDDLVVGWLFGEGYIDRFEDIRRMRPCAKEPGFWVDIAPERVAAVEASSRRRILASGCGSVTAFLGSLADVPRRTGAIPELNTPVLRALFKEMFGRGGRYKETGGIHAAALTDGAHLLFHAEDIGRHNAVDKVLGAAVQAGRLPDDLILLESRSRFRTLFAEMTAQRQWGRWHHFFAGNTHTYTQAWSAGYRENTPSEYRTALFASWKYHREKFSSQASLRKEMADGKFLPVLPALGIDWQFHPSLTLKGKISRNYRLPTLNDRFWMPGGNPALLPESGWSQELALAHKMERRNLKIEISITVFNRNIDDWILWSPREGQSFWSANNITRVWSRGLEPRFSVAWAFKDVHLTWKGGYDYIRSTNQVALENPKMEKGDQLIYTPVHQAFSVFSLEWKALYLAYQHACTGPADGINEALNAFQTGHVRLQYSGSIQKYKGTIFFNIYNIWDADYLVVERRPMPGIHFHAGIHLIFHQNSKS
ncbi:MAG: TonB-dependent receptor [Gemmatimonadaceae bacterium]|nr:TonB-dependent receptor [Gemmatimonadaceae bacterium]